MWALAFWVAIMLGSMDTAYVRRWVVQRMLGLDVHMLGQNALLLPGLGLRRWASSQYNGVYWNKGVGKFQAQVSLRGQRTHAGLFRKEREAAHAYDAYLRALCDDGARLSRSLNFPTPLEASFEASTEVWHESRRCALAKYSENASKEDESFDRLRRLFVLSPHAESYEIVRVSDSSKVDALFQRRGSLTGGLALKSSRYSQKKNGYAFSQTCGYAGMLLVLVALDSNALWALPGACVTHTSFFIRPGSSRDLAFQVEDVGSLLASCFRNRHDFPHISLADARLKCSPCHQVEEQAHTLLATVFHCASYQLEKSFTGFQTVDSVLFGEGCRWCVQEKASTGHTHRRYAAGLWKYGGVLGKLPYAKTDFDLLVVSLLDDGRLTGCFLFPTDILTQLECLGHKPCWLPLHPPWSLPKREDTREKYAWQLEYFVDLRKWVVETPLPGETRDFLKNLLRRLGAAQKERTHFLEYDALGTLDLFLEWGMAPCAEQSGRSQVLSCSLMAPMQA